MLSPGSLEAEASSVMLMPSSALYGPPASALGAKLTTKTAAAWLSVGLISKLAAMLAVLVNTVCVAMLGSMVAVMVIRPFWVKSRLPRSHT